MRFIHNHRGVSHVIGYVMMVGLISATTVGVLLTTNSIISNRTQDAASLMAQDIANNVADAVMGAINARRTLYDAYHETTLDIPYDIAGRYYYIELTETRVWVNSTDGTVSENCTTYNAEEFDYGITGKGYPSDGKIKIYCKKTEDVYKFDFGTDESDVEFDYRRATEDTKYNADLTPPLPPGWTGLSDYKFRMPIIIDNSCSQYEKDLGLDAQDLTDYQLLIYLYPTNFDYSKVSNDFDYSKVSDMDLCVADEDGNALGYWIEFWDPYGTSKIWVKLQKHDSPGEPFIKRDECKTIYVYYGYITGGKEIDQSEPISIFEFYDDFENLDSWLYDNTVASPAELIDEDLDGINDLVKIYAGGGDGDAIIAKHILFNKTDTVLDPVPGDGDTFISYTNYNVEAMLKLTDPGGTDADASLVALATGPVPIFPAGFREGTNVRSTNAPLFISIEDVEKGDSIISVADPTAAPPAFCMAIIRAEETFRWSKDIFGALDMDRYVTISVDGGTYTVDAPPRQMFLARLTNLVVTSNYWVTAQQIHDEDFPSGFTLVGLWFYDDVAGTHVCKSPVTTSKTITIEDCYTFSTDEFGCNIPPDPYTNVGTFYANGFLTLAMPSLSPPIDPGASPDFVDEGCYVLSSRIRGTPGKCFYLNKTNVPSAAGPVTIGSGYYSMEDDWSMVRFGVFLAKSYNKDYGIDWYKHPQFYTVLGAARFNTDINRNIGGLNCILYNKSEVSNPSDPAFNLPTNIFDTKLDPKWENAPGDPYWYGVMGLGCGLNGGDADDYVEVDWFRVYQSLMYNLNVKYNGLENEESLWYGWGDPGNGKFSKETNLIDSNILCDVVYSSDGVNDVFYINGLEPDLYTISVTVGDYDDPRTTKVSIYENSILLGEEVTVETETNKFDTILFLVTKTEAMDMPIEIKFDTDAGEQWAVNSIKIERGEKNIKIE